MKEATNSGALRSIFELGARQELQVIGMIDKKVGESENRVLAAIADLKSEIITVRSDLKSEISTVNGRVDALKTLMITTLSAMGVVHTGLLVWIVNRLLAG